MVLQADINYRIKCKLILCLFVFHKHLIPTSLIFANYFHSTQNQYMLFWLLKDA